MATRILTPADIFIAHQEKNPELANILAKIAVNHSKNGIREVLPGQCVAKYHFLLIMDGKQLKKEFTTLHCHRIDGHNGNHQHNTLPDPNLGPKLRWSYCPSFEEVDWKELWTKH